MSKHTTTQASTRTYSSTYRKVNNLPMEDQSNPRPFLYNKQSNMKYQVEEGIKYNDILSFLE